MVWPPNCATTDNCADTTCGGAKESEINLVRSGLYDASEDKMVEVALECNYEKNCTPLYKQIEQEDWGVVAGFLDTGYWPGHFFPDNMSPTEQVMTWVTRFEPGEEGEEGEEEDANIRWSQLPLHLAIVVDAPLGIVRRLVEHYPRGVQCTDDQSMLPLHLALRQGAPDEVVDYLLKVFPDAVNVRGKNRRTAIECAMRGRRKARARILQTFLDLNKSYEARELQSIMSRLEDRNHVIDDLQTKLCAIEENKSLVETDLATEIARLNEIKSR